MEFDIKPQPIMEGNNKVIRLPEELLLELDVMEGQFIQLAGKEELILQVKRDVSFRDGEDKAAHISPKNFARLNDKSVKLKMLDITLGCDPEFFVIWRSRMISAATYLPYSGEIGCDGNLGEIRPRYTRHENELVSNIAKLVPLIPSRMKRSSWATGFPPDGKDFRYEAHSYNWGLAAGFHVHLGIPPEILNTRTAFNRAAMNHLVQCLDWYVSVPLVPLEINHSRRLGLTSYGKPGDYRPSNITLEYRTPGAFYLRTPALTRGLLGLCLMVTENVVRRMREVSKDFVNLHKLEPMDLQEIMPIPEPERIKNILFSKESTEPYKKLDGIHKTLTRFPNYKDHKKSIETFLDMVRINRRPEADLLKNWKELK